MIWQTTYQSGQGCVSRPEGAKEGNAFDDLLHGSIAARLHDTAGLNALTECLRGFSLLGMGLDALEEAMVVEASKTCDGSVGEVFAEALRLKQMDSLPAIRQRLDTLTKQVSSEVLGREDALCLKVWMIMDGEQ